MTIDKLMTILDAQLDVGHYVLINIISQSNEQLDHLWSNIKIRGWREALIKKQFIEELNNKYYLTEKGKQLYQKINQLEELPESKSIINNNQLTEFSQQLNQKINNLIYKSRSESKLILKNGFIFNITNKLLEDRLKSFFIKFKITDLELIEKSILNYVEDVLKDKITTPRTLKYFIWKDDKNKGLVSDLALYIESYSEKKSTFTSTKELF